jgi:hypothetical protein
VNWLKKPFIWLGKNLSTDGTSSNSRALQSIIVINLTAILWVVMAKAGYVISDNARLVMICLICSGAGSYSLGKFAERGEQ